eukprot:3323477-Prymnesium_polylepis.1
MMRHKPVPHPGAMYAALPAVGRCLWHEIYMTSSCTFFVGAPRGRCVSGVRSSLTHITQPTRRRER